MLIRSFTCTYFNRPLGYFQLSGNVGKVKVKKPVINYLNYQPKEPELDYEGKTNVNISLYYWISFELSSFERKNEKRVI